jgi:hypothetical protein
MFSTATEFVSNQIVSSAIWNLAESGVEYTKQIVGHYLAAATPTPIAGANTTAQQRGLQK